MDFSPVWYSVLSKFRVTKCLILDILSSFQIMMNNGPFDNQTNFHDLNTRLVGYSDLHCNKENLRSDTWVGSNTGKVPPKYTFFLLWASSLIWLIVLWTVKLEWLFDKFVRKLARLLSVSTVAGCLLFLRRSLRPSLFFLDQAKRLGFDVDAVDVDVDTNGSLTPFFPGADFIDLMNK